jgi:hypothetical protein
MENDVDHDPTSSEKAKAARDNDLKKLAELEREIRKAETGVIYRRLHGETDLGFVEDDTQTEQPDKKGGAI